MVSPLRDIASSSASTTIRNCFLGSASRRVASMTRARKASDPVGLATSGDLAATASAYPGMRAASCATTDATNSCGSSEREFCWVQKCSATTSSRWPSDAAMALFPTAAVDVHAAGNNQSACADCRQIELLAFTRCYRWSIDNGGSLPCSSNSASSFRKMSARFRTKTTAELRSAPRARR